MSLVHVVEHVLRRRRRSAVQRAVRLGLGLRGADLAPRRRASRRRDARRRSTRRCRPGAPQPLDRVAERPRRGLVLRSVPGRVVRRRVRAHAVRDPLDERRVRARRAPARRPTAARRAPRGSRCRRRAATGARSRGRAIANVAARPRANRLVVEIAHWLLTMLRMTGGLVRRREHQRGVEVGLGRRAVADPRRRRSRASPLIADGHRPARPPARTAWRGCPRSRRSRTRARSTSPAAGDR